MAERVRLARTVLDVIRFQERLELLSKQEPDALAAVCSLIGFDPADVEKVRIYRADLRDKIIVEVDVIDGWEPTYEIGMEELLMVPTDELGPLLALARVTRT